MEIYIYGSIKLQLFVWREKLVIREIDIEKHIPQLFERKVIQLFRISHKLRYQRKVVALCDGRIKFHRLNC